MFIQILDYVEYEQFMEKAVALMQARDVKDADYLACALSVNADFIWTNDEDFLDQKAIQMRTTQQFIDSQRI